MKNIKSKSSLLIGDKILVVFLILLIILLFLPSIFFRSEKLLAEISFDDQTEVYELYKIEESEKLKVGGCEILLEKDGVSFLKSECPDGLCVKRGKLKRPGDTMACVPQKVVITVKSEKKSVFHASTF